MVVLLLLSARGDLGGFGGFGGFGVVTSLSSRSLNSRLCRSSGGLVGS